MDGDHCRSLEFGSPARGKRAESPDPKILGSHEWVLDFEAVSKGITGKHLGRNGSRSGATRDDKVGTETISFLHNDSFFPAKSYCSASCSNALPISSVAPGPIRRDFGLRRSSELPSAFLEFLLLHVSQRRR